MGFLKRKNTKKEARMKKFIVIALALFLAIPAISFAGSATSRWDVTIGGYIKADFGYTTQLQGADYYKAERGSKADMTTLPMSMATISQQAARQGSTSLSRVPMDGAPRQ